MRYIKNFKSFLILENFDLNKMYDQQKYVPEIREEAKKIVDRYFNGNGEIPVDMVKNRDKVEFWLAKQIKEYVVNKVNISLNNMFEAGQKEEVEKARPMLNYFKGKTGEGVETDKNIINGVTRELILKYERIHNMELTGIFDYFLSPARNIQQPINLVSSTLADLNAVQIQWHQELKASGRIYKEDGIILKKYPDGYYWIDLETNSSSEEADAMGHCGRTTSDTILSLRRRTEGGHITPHVTIAIDYGWNAQNYKRSLNYEDSEKTKPEYDTIHQIKGKGNTKPVEAYHKYIVDIIVDEELGIESIANDEYSPENDFHVYDLVDNDLIDKILENKPDLFKGTALIFFKDRLKEIAEKFPNLVKDAVHLIDIMTLRQQDIITEEIFKEKIAVYQNAYVEDGKVYATISELSELSFAFGGDRDYNYEDIYKKYVGGDFHPDWNDTKYELSDIPMDDLDKESIKAILDAIDLDDIEDMEQLEVEDIDLENIKEDILNNDDRYNTKLIALVGQVEEMKDALTSAYRNASDDADSEDAYKTCIKAAENYFNIKKIENGYAVQVLTDWALFSYKYDLENLSSSRPNMLDFLSDPFENTDDYTEFQDDEEFEMLKIDLPYYGWSGTVTAQLFNDHVISAIESM